jgi:hypothetical protein
VLEDGFVTTISFTGAGTTFEEITAQPPGLDNEEAIQTTTMRNVRHRTKAARQLLTTTDGEVTVAYDPAAYSNFITNIGINQSIVWTFPDESTLTVWGYAKTFIPDALEEGKRPTAKITIVVTNRNASGVETGPVEA